MENCYEIFWSGFRSFCWVYAAVFIVCCFVLTGIYNRWKLKFISESEIHLSNVIFLTSVCGAITGISLIPFQVHCFWTLLLPIVAGGVVFCVLFVVILIIFLNMNNLEEWEENK